MVIKDGSLLISNSFNNLRFWNNLDVSLSWQRMARAMDGHPRGMERWSGSRKRRGTEPHVLEAAWADGGK